MSTIMPGKNYRPIVAVFLSQAIVSALKMQKNNTFKVRQLVKANELAGTTLFFFSVNSVDFNHSKIRGVYFDVVKKVWAEKDFPFPDVLYDRVKGAKTLNITGDEIRRRFDNLGIKKINSRHYFDKWELHQLLERNDKLRKHLPETIIYNSETDLANMLSRYDKIYIKGRTGCRGKQVMSVTRLPEKGYEFRIFLSKIISGRVNDIQSLKRVVKSFLSGKNIILQQAIDLLSVDGCIVDFRGELQRNGSGELTITAIPARIGKKNSPIATNGMSYPFEDFFKEVLNYTQDEIARLKNTMETLLLDIYRYMEQSYGPFGELGIDIGMDKEAKLWFFECNAKSAKVSLCNTAEGETLQRAFLNPLQYARYISRFPSSRSMQSAGYSYPSDSA
jgi:hypothetical protein